MVGVSSRFLRPQQIGTDLAHAGLNPARVPLYLANSQTLGTAFSPRMRWADIEVPNRLAAMDARRRSACYPQRTFYPLSYGPSTRDHRITKASFHFCSCRSTRSQADLYLYARRPIANRTESAFALLRYSFGGDRPSQTTHLTRFPARFHGSG